ncbi:MAG TPA: Hsp20/alpha crystallin family protein [Acidimicrobiia bacterium]|nr:Hsp20/alpha crystallin family protein [Acidimicrobiia bacterium]
MALIRLRPFTQVLDPSGDVMGMQTQMNRLFDNFFGQPSQPGMMERAWTPPVDMYETKNEVVVTVELPGVNDKDIRLSITGDLLTIQGERQWSDETRDAGHYRQERWFGKFERALSLPIPVETGQVKATYRDGVLTVKLPKTEGVKPKEIKIDAA